MVSHALLLHPVCWIRRLHGRSLMVVHALVLHPVCWIRRLRGESVKEDAPKIAQEEGECAAGSNEASAAHGGGLVEDGGRNLEADAVLDVVQAAVVVVPHLGSTLLLRGEFHTLPARGPPQNQLSCTISSPNIQK